jgi:hypothetical protein
MKSVDDSLKIKNRTTIGFSMPLLGIYPKDSKSTYNRNTQTPIFTAALLTIAKI